MKKIIKKEYYETITKYKDEEVTVCDKCGEEITLPTCSFCHKDLCRKCNNIVFDNTNRSYPNNKIRICQQCAEVEPFKSTMVLAKIYWDASEKLYTKMVELCKLL